MATPLKRPATPTQVIACLICKRWHPSIAFYNGSKACRRIGADLIRQTIGALRTRRSLPVEVRVLVETIDVTADDHECERTWRNAIDALRVLYHASAIGTGREKSLLLEVARNRRLVAGMRLASRFSKDIPPNWLAVFAAEGSADSKAIVVKARRRYATDRRLLGAIDGFSGPVDRHARRKHGPRPPRASATMNTARFWRILDETGSSGTSDEALRQLLTPLSARQIAAFNRHFFSMLRRAYRRDLWGAAYLMLGGCSDDAFRDFRAELIGRGRVVFERVLKDPDSLADDHTDIEGDESLPSVANDVYFEKVGHDLPTMKGESKQPAGKPWNFDDQKELRSRYPRLYRRFRGAARRR
jgi:hypothetical protein